jgi:cytochrome P450
MADTQSIRRVTTLTGDPAWQVTDYPTVKRLLGDPRLGRSHPDPARASRLSESVIFGNPMSSPETEKAEHARFRRMLSPAFSARRIENLRASVQELVDGLLDDLARTTPPADLHEALSFPLPALVICQLLGVPYEDRDDFRRWSDDAGAMTDGARSRAGVKNLFRYMQRLIARKRTEPAEDVISDLIAAQREDPTLTDDDLTSTAAGLLFAGHETTVSAIDRGTVLMLTNDAQREALQRDPGLVPAAVEEILRHPDPFESPARGNDSGLPRYASAPIEVGDVTIQTGDLVLLATRTANRDPGLFPQPERFQVARERNPHLTFGHGPHFCIGAPLARLELQVVFGSLFRRFPTLRLAVPVEQLHPRTGILTGGLEELPVAW